VWSTDRRSSARNVTDRQRESRDKLTHLLSPTSPAPPPAFHVTSSVSMATADAATRAGQHLSRFDVDVSCRSMSKSASASSLTLPAPHRQYLPPAVRCAVLFARCVYRYRYLLWSPYGIGQTIIFLPCAKPLALWFLLLLFSSPNLSRRRLDVCRTSTHGVALVRI